MPPLQEKAGDTDVALRREQVSAEGLGLSETDTTRRGWRRVRCGKGWKYVDIRGRCVAEAGRSRCRQLAIPPAWQDVWINPDAEGHIQACGTDAAGRRQYIYHPAWREGLDTAKFSDLPAFADRLPRLRARVQRILTESEDDLERALAVLVRLLDSGGLRIGHRRFRALSGAVGATTLKSRHVHIEDGHITLMYPSKSGQKRRIDLDDPYLCEALEEFAGPPGKDLFDFGDRRIRAADVNAFLREMTGASFTSKDFRTWGGSVVAAGYLRRHPQAKIGEVTGAAATWLGNTPAIARNSYIHPAIIEAVGTEMADVTPAGPKRLRADERWCYGLITRS